MAQTKISQLPDATTPLAGTEIVPLLQGGVNKKTAVSNLPGGGAATWGTIGGTLSAQTDLQAALDLKESLYRTFDRKTGDYPLVLADATKGIEMNVAGANTVTVPLNATQAFPIGTLIPVVQYGAGLTSIVATGGVTINTSAGNLDSPGQFAPMFLRKIATNEWYLWNGTAGGVSGDLQDVLDAGSSATITSDVSIIRTGEYSLELKSTGVTIGTTNDPIIISAGASAGGSRFDLNLDATLRLQISSHNDYYTSGGVSHHRFFVPGAGAQIRLMEESGSGSNYIALKAPTDVTTAQVYTFPAAGPATDGEALTSTTGGTLAWVKRIGIQDLFISATAMWARVTGGCADLARSEIATSLFNIQTLDFDQTTQEFCQFQIVLPRKWNNGTVTAIFYWTAAAGSGTVQWGISGGAYSNDDALTVALGSAQTADDTLIATNDLHISPETSAITLAGTPADADFLAFQISRNPASDTLSADAKLLGVSIRITTDATVDA